MSSAAFVSFFCSRLLQQKSIIPVIHERPRPSPNTRDKPSISLTFGFLCVEVLLLEPLGVGEVKVRGELGGGNEREGKYDDNELHAITVLGVCEKTTMFQHTRYCPR